MTHPSWILGIFLVYVATVHVHINSPPDPPCGGEPLCKALCTLRNYLNFTSRRTFMNYNFPINYTIRVHYEEILRFNNISQLKFSLPDLQEVDLQELWLEVNMEVLKKVLKVLPQKHPSYKYTSELEELFRKVQQVSNFQEKELPDQIQELLDNMKDPNTKMWKSVKPKALMDNCYRTMHCLFPHCFPTENKQADYCSVHYWKMNSKYPKNQEGSTSAVMKNDGQPPTRRGRK
ncbi:interleukin-34 [Brienomyrus brachyistius]|uniref:interleukin-34 n=1 Tax=Brienomyrus brachyistius TaxID=42636 RepID=UPI0020B3EB2C|nr:interleukin-34 [Brienomyrus brachyistius]XP_048828628.1 interleukin-34 [Brienomyrus brachyistius]XP_048828629.1 interleukin-34 [Brienomyrus brachyistius]